MPENAGNLFRFAILRHDSEKRISVFGKDRAVNKEPKREVDSRKNHLVTGAPREHATTDQLCFDFGRIALTGTIRMPRASAAFAQRAMRSIETGSAVAVPMA
jgi:hypothetical protein